MNRIEFAIPSELRYLFATICVFSEPFSPVELWLKYREALSEDFTRKNIDEETIFHIALMKINKILNSFGMSNNDFNLPFYKVAIINSVSSNILNNDNNSNNKTITNQISANNLNNEQKIAFDKIISSIENINQQKLFMIDGPGGFGESYSFHCL